MCVCRSGIYCAIVVAVSFTVLLECFFFCVAFFFYLFSASLHLHCLGIHHKKNKAPWVSLWMNGNVRLNGALCVCVLRWQRRKFVDCMWRECLLRSITEKGMKLKRTKLRCFRILRCVARRFENIFHENTITIHTNGGMLRDTATRNALRFSPYAKSVSLCSYHTLACDIYWGSDNSSMMPHRHRSKARHIFQLSSCAL